jgi:hypothetical protein
VGHVGRRDRSLAVRKGVGERAENKSMEGVISLVASGFEDT